MREITFCEAIREATHQEMERDGSIFVYGIGVPDHKAIFGSVAGLVERFGPERCLDTPISEDTMTGVGIGAALVGMRPIHIHIRVDFLILALNQIANSMTTIAYNSGGKLSVPLVIRAVIGRGWGQGCQHSKSMFSTFAHIPGLKVLAPTTPKDAKGLLTAAIRDSNPVLLLEHRWLYWQKGPVPEEAYEVPIGSAQVLRDGKHISLIGMSWMNVEAMHAADLLIKHHGIHAEVVDIRSLAPLDIDCLVTSVRKTRRCLILDNDWAFCGISAEISAQISEHLHHSLISPPLRLGFVHTPCPTARHLEDEFYPNAENIFRKVEEMLGLSPKSLDNEQWFSHEHKFKGPF
jgi:acetoin:2,6-dichlorophenolindophenol oxidoreductase subunit beta